MTEAQRRLDAVLRSDFVAFVHKAVDTLCPGQQFQSNWHLQAIGHALAPAERRAGARLIVTMPPRSLKSISISVAWVAWMLGRNPSLRFVCVSYSAELALKHARDCRTLLTSAWYCRVFPGTRLQRLNEQGLETNAGGGRLSTSVGGTLTGQGGDIIIIDDPIKPDEAASETTRRNVIEWYASTLASRLDDKATGSIVLVMQRVHEGDLAGHLLEAGGWSHLNLPAIAEIDETIPLGPSRVHHRKVGDLLHAQREPLSVLEAQRAVMGTTLFSAQYQQAPVPAGGAMILRDWLRHFADTPGRTEGTRVVQSWDCASKDGVLNDYSVCITAAIHGRDVYILDVFRERLKFPDLVQTAIRLARRHSADSILIEDAASGTQLIQTLRSQQPAGVHCPIARRPEGDKVSRMSGASQRIENGELFLPEHAPWRATFERELLAFPGGRQDDQADALSQLLIWDSRRPTRSLTMGPIEVSADDGFDWWKDGPSLAF